MTYGEDGSIDTRHTEVRLPLPVARSVSRRAVLALLGQSPIPSSPDLGFVSTVQLSRGHTALTEDDRAWVRGLITAIAELRTDLPRDPWTGYPLIVWPVPDSVARLRECFDDGFVHVAD